LSAKEKMSGVSILRQVKKDFDGLTRMCIMSKRELIDYIREINRSARPEFLAAFSKEDLNDYLEHLMDLDLEELVICS